jgi:hypothetical protein
MNEFGLEDLVLGIHTPMENDNTLSKESLKIPGFAELIKDNGADDYESYSMEAMEEYNQASIIGLYAVQSLERMNSEVTILNKIKTNYGVEALNPYFSLEADSGGSSKPSLFKRIWSAIVTVFQRLVLAIGNFVRACINWLRSQALKGKMAFYEKHKSTIETAVKSKKLTGTLKARLPYKSLDKIKTDVIKSFGGIDSISKKIEGLQNEINGYLDRLDKAAENANKSVISSIVIGLHTIFGKNGHIATGTKIKKVFVDSMDAITCGNSKAKELMMGETIKLNSPTKVASLIFYNSPDPKAASVTHAKVLEMIPLTFLAKDTVDAINTFIKKGQQSLKDLNKQIQIMRKWSNDCERIAKKRDKNKQGFAQVTQALHAIGAAGNTARNFHGFAVGIILNIQKEFLNCQGVLSQVCHSIVKISKKGESKDKKDDKKK